jgi:hypothetical protein
MKISNQIFLALFSVSFFETTLSAAPANNTKKEDKKENNTDKEIDLNEEIALFNGKSILMKDIVNMGPYYGGPREAKEYKNPAVVAYILFQMLYVKYLVDSNKEYLSSEEGKMIMEISMSTAAARKQNDTFLNQAIKEESYSKYMTEVDSNQGNSKKAEFILIRNTDGASVNNLMASINANFTSQSVANIVKNSGDKVEIIPIRSSISSDKNTVSSTATLSELSLIFKQKDGNPISSSTIKKGSKIAIEYEGSQCLLLVLETSETSLEEKKRIAMMIAFREISKQFFSKFLENIKNSKSVSIKNKEVGSKLDEITSKIDPKKAN